MFRPWLNNIDLNKRILEIGPLAMPNIKKDQGKSVFYADIKSTEDIKNIYMAERYKEKPSWFNEIVEIDFVINNGKYYECLKDVEKFDYIIATHVIEHIPQLILFFQDIAKILNQKGKICLSIPDKRYCYDHFRCPTSFAECYDIYIRGINNLPFRIFDELAVRTLNNAEYWWRETNNFEHLPRAKNNFDQAKEKYMRALNGEYFDMHFSVFTPETFLLLIYFMICYNLFPFKCVEFNKTEINTFEFNCVLELDINISVENSIENQKEKENIINLLTENSDTECLMIEIENLKNNLQKSKDDLEAILSSKSWKITAPLRKLKAIINKFIR